VPGLDAAAGGVSTRFATRLRSRAPNPADLLHGPLATRRAVALRALLRSDLSDVDQAAG
jgi:hypothetical protein